MARARRRDEVDTLVATACREFTAAELTTLLDDIGIACARINTLPVVAEHPQLVQRDRWVETPTPRRTGAHTAPSNKRTRKGLPSTPGARTR